LESSKGLSFWHTIRAMTARRGLITALMLGVMAMCVWMWRWNDSVGWTTPGPWLIEWFGLTVPVWLTVAAWILAALALGVVWLWRPRPSLLFVAPALAVLALVTAYGILMEYPLLTPPGPGMVRGPAAECSHSGLSVSATVPSFLEG